MAQDITLPLDIEDIEIPDGRRHVDAASVKRLAESIEKIGLRHPITVRRKGERYILVAGLHRLEACRKLGRDHVLAIISSFTNAEARLWEIAENLHRADLTKQERADQIAEWVRLTEVISSQVATKGRPEGGERAAARELGLDKDEVNRSVKIASITPEAKEAAREAGFDDNQSKLLQIARKPASEQMATVRALAAGPLDDADAVEKQIASLMSAWNKAGPEARKAFLERIDTPLMDRRFG